MELNRARNELVRRLAVHGGWMDRDALAAGLGWSEGRLDDELADLVVSQAALFNDRARQYRLAGTTMARQAAARLLRGPAGQQRCMLGRQSADKQRYEVGIARRDAGGVVMAELELPYPAGDLAELDRMAAALGSWASAAVESAP